MDSKIKHAVWEACMSAGTIGISGHVHPDGDCIGAAMSLYLYLNKINSKARIDVYLEEPPAAFHDIQDIEKVHTAVTEEMVYDVFFVLDCPKDRMGEAEKLFDEAKTKIHIDHHISSSGCGDVNYIVPSASSTSELIFDLLEEEYLDAEIAKAIYIGIIHDTGIFQYSNTSPKTLTTAARLISYGFAFPDLISETFYEKTYVQNQIMGRVLLESILFMDGRCIVSTIDRKTLEFYGASSKDLDGIVNQLRLTKGIECAIFIYETGMQEHKVSLRSTKKVDVAKVAAYFGGGGHVRAAGCAMQGTCHDVINNLSLHIEKQLLEWDQTT